MDMRKKKIDRVKDKESGSESNKSVDILFTYEDRIQIAMTII